MSGRAEHRRTAGAAGLIALATLAAYAGSFSAPFLFDDVAAIEQNATLAPLRRLGRVLVPPRDATVGGRPLLNLTLAVNHAIGGTAVWSYHALNLAIHIAAALALFGIVRRTLARLGRNTADASRVSLAAALLWVLHPLQTEAVTYIVQRAESLMGMFYLLTLYGFVRGAEEVGAGRPALPAIRQNHESTSFVWFGLSWLACLLGMATKEVMVTAPVMVFFYDRTFAAGSFREAWAKRWGYYIGLASTWILLLALVASVGWNRNGAAGFDVGIKPWAYWLTQFEAVARYLRLSVWPRPLVFEYGTFWVRGFREVAPSALLVLALLAATLVALRRRPALGFLGLWFFGILALTSAVPGTTQMIVEHRMYLSLAAVAVLAALGADALGRRLFPFRPAFALLPALVLAAILGALTERRNRDYRSELALWQDTVAKCPASARAQNGLAVALYKLGRFAEALGPCRAAIRINPNYADADYNLGNIDSELGRWSEAAARYAEALRLKPSYAEAHNNLGIALSHLGRWSEAERQYEAVIGIEPGNAGAHYNSGLALSQLGHAAEAIAQYQAALRSDPGLKAARHNLGNSLRDLGRYDQAAAEYERVLAADPGDAEALNDLGLCLADRGRWGDAIARYEAALRIRPNFPQAENNLGLALENSGHRDGAIARYRRALALAPRYAPAEYHLGLALQASGHRDEAIACYARTLEFEPNLAEAANILGNALAGEGRWPEAVAAYRRALRARPDFAGAHYDLALAMLHAGDPAAAATEFEAALRFGPDSAEAETGWGAALAMLGRTAEAAAHYRRALQIEPDYAPARTNLEAVRSR